MRRLTRLGLAAAVTAASLASLLGPAAPAQAGGFGLQLKIVSYDWVPRTGNLEVTATVDCPRRIWSASWSLTIRQRVSAKGFQEISCTGQTQRLTLVLDPKNGRFHPGAATQDLTTVECLSDFCAGLVYPTSDIRIPPPGHHHTPGAR
jgi:hypothetical protein